MANKNNPAKAPKESASKRGGARSGSGRPTVYTLLEKMAIALRVAEVQKQHQCSRAEAIRQMQFNNELPGQSISNIARYLTPKYLSPQIAEVLMDAPERRGIIAAIPTPLIIRTKKTKV